MFASLQNCNRTPAEAAVRRCSSKCSPENTIVVGLRPATFFKKDSSKGVFL